jgi:DNA (cytosine-5)-methyltransferase 1
VIVRAVDLFCGGGGCSTGLAEACEDLDREVVLAAVNHWEFAIQTHERNHPWADHYHCGVDELTPVEVFPNTDAIEILIAAPSCTDYSKARGGQPVTPQDRMDPFAILDWVAQLRPRSILVENVPEFVDWGPVVDGAPTRNGQFFDAWTHTLEDLGYTVEHRTLCAADYGDPTTRKRLFVVARRDDVPVWPEPTHGEDGDVPGTEPWRPAAEVIDWSERGQSIWTRGLRGQGKRPLANNTMQRIAQGIRRYADDALEPYADALEALDPDAVCDLQDDVVPAREAPVAAEQRDGPFLVRGRVPTALADGGSTGEDAARTYDDAVGLCVPVVRGQHGGSVPRNAGSDPVQTVATRGAIQLIEPETFVLPRNQYHRDVFSNPAYDPDARPLHTVTAKNHDGHVVSSYLVPYYGEREGQAPRTHDPDAPVPTVTVTGSDPYLAAPHLVVYNGESDASDVDDPLPTVTTRDRFALALPELYPWGLDVRYRMLQPRELAAAQGFPDDYEFVGDTKADRTEQIGNAVPVNLATALCKRLLQAGSPTLDTFTDGAETEGST